METIWEILDKQIEFDSSEDSDTCCSDNDITNRSDSTGSPSRKQLPFRRLREFKTARELEELKSVAADVIELKDYAKWFKSRSQPNMDDILNPENYGEWFSTLGTVAMANVIVAPYNYCTWFDYFVVHGGEGPRPYEMETIENKNRRYGELALAHFNKTLDCSEEYEYTRQCEILEFEHFIHLNFYARLKVSESRQKPGPNQLFFAEVFRTYDTLQIWSVSNAWNSARYVVPVVRVMIEQLDTIQYFVLD
ncbi:hypothetical protein KSS87_021195 [Heliosperma pusillum]|nr:hypothetical protein KSS87_021195 [Heliosperma pusillum]